MLLFIKTSKDSIHITAGPSLVGGGGKASLKSRSGQLKIFHESLSIARVFKPCQI